MNTNILEIRNIAKEYNGQIILKGVDLNIKEGEFVTLLGPSGCGKTTLLRLIAGFEQPSSGSLLFKHKDLTKIPVHEREINTIFQSYSLFPHLNVFENIAYGLKVRKVSKEKIRSEVMKVLRLMKLPGYENKNIFDLSGGQQQRVAIARALVNKPSILLLDEPFAALDLNLRKSMQLEIKKLQKEIGITFIFVTHDQEEALTMSDRIVVLNSGQIQQIGVPQYIYNEPENKWTAQFIGSSNVIEDAVYVRDNLVMIDGKQLACLDVGFGENEKNIDLVIRPEDIDIVATDKGFFNGKILSSIFKGSVYEVVVKTKKRNYLVHTTDEVELDQAVGLHWNVEDIHVMWKEIDE